MQKLEDASMPLQQFFDVRITRDKHHQDIVARLPNPLATLYSKLKVFEEQHSEFKF
jgi:hypothetical protein